MKKYQGSCLCKNVQFELEGKFAGFYFCHCSRCRKVTGSAHGANLFAREGTLNWLSGQEFVKTFSLGGTRFAKTFCTNCGGALPTSKEAGSIVVPAGSLDCNVDVKPTAHIFVGSKANWDDELESVESFEELPNKV